MFAVRPSNRQVNPFESRYRQIVEQGREAWFADAYYDELTDFWRSWLSRLEVASGRVLEVGCGVGRLASALASDGFEVVGIDVSETAILAARDLPIPAWFVVADIQSELPFTPTSFELVLDSDCLHHIAGDGRERFFAEAFRVLKPGGRLLVKTNVGEPDPEDWERFGYDPVTRTTRIDGQVANYFATRQEVMRGLARAGFIADTIEERPAGPDSSAQLYVAAHRPKW